MKRLILFVACAMTLAVSSCSKFDDSEIWDKLKNHESRITKLEELCKQLNTNINSLQSIVQALDRNDYITNVSEIRKDGEIIGYTITFAHSDTITIYHGEDGQDGQDGYTPQIGVMKDTDDNYYWTIDGEWLLDSKGNKIKANGEDGSDGTNGSNGQNGANGQDGITPRLKIENDYWYVSYDNGATWTELGKATGEDGSDGIDGSNGADGDTLFKSIDIYNGYVVFTLNDGNDTIIKLPFFTETSVTITLSETDNIIDVLTDEQKRSTTKLTVNGFLDEEDLKFIVARMPGLEYLDISECHITMLYFGDTCGYILNPWGSQYINNSIKHIILPVLENKWKWGIDHMMALETITTSNIILSPETTVECLPYLNSIILADGIESTEELLPNNFDDAFIQDGIYAHWYLPASLKSIGQHFFAHGHRFYPRSITIYAETPPTMIHFTTDAQLPKFKVGSEENYKVPVYVPAESVELYKNALGWKDFVNIYPIPEN